MGYHNLLFIYFTIIGQVFLFGQNEKTRELPRKTQESGYPFIQNYTPDDYNAFTQNWGTVQDSSGILYFANGDGVLMYDGVNWEVIELPNHGHAKSIAIDENNHIYVGASSEFGYLEPDNLGKLVYVSLSSLLDEQDQNFTTIWEIHTAKEAVYFRAADALFRWSDGSFKVWKTKGRASDLSFKVDDKLFQSRSGVGLGFINGDTFELLPNGEFFANKLVRTILPLSKDDLLIGTINAFYTYRDNVIVPFKTEVDEFIAKNTLYNAIKLNDGSFALATVSGGIAIINDVGQLLLTLNKDDTLASLTVQSLFQDRSGILWAALGYGISKIEYPNPFSNFNELGATTRCNVITRLKNKVYAGNGNGLYYLTSDEFGTSSFKQVLGMNYKIWDLLVFEDLLLVADENGVYQLKNNIVSRLGNWNPSAFLRSELDTNRVFISLADGLGSIYYKNGDWHDEGQIAGVNGSTYTIIEESTGDLWLETSEDWLWKVSFKSKEMAIGLQNPISEKYGSAQGLPGDTGNLYKIDDTIFFVSNNGRETYGFDSKSNSFFADSTLNKSFGMPGKSIFINHVDEGENVFFSMSDMVDRPKQLVAWNLPDNQYKTEDLKEERISDLIGISMFAELKDSVIWHGGLNGIIRHDLKDVSINYIPNNALISKVIYKEDSLLRSGSYDYSSVIVPFKNNRFRFQFANPGFYREDANTYQYKLLGFDEDWSGWTLETKKDYTNIPEGNYTFNVRSKDVYGQVGGQDSFIFTILPPWYRSWWAYSLYILTAILAIILLMQWRSRQLLKKNLALETIVRKRTTEIIQKNSQLERQTHQLQMQTEQLKDVDRMKTRLFANISHEFRTPLTLIKGPIEKLEEARKNEISTSNMKMIRRNANRLLKLVNQLLDLSKLDFGSLSLEPSEGNLYKCLRAAASSFSSHAAQRNIDYHIKIPSRTLWASFDRDKLEKIIYNLLSNAFKFSPDKATIGFYAKYVYGNLEIKVSDSGYGIPSDKMPHIFDRFYQVDDSFTREKEGTGIGLALTKELVDLQGGSIHVESEYQKGSIFRITLPFEEIKTYEKEDAEVPIGESKIELDSLLVKESKKSKHKGLSRVLIIEDHSDMRYFIKQQLLEKYRIIEAFNGKDGLEKARENSPDLIITDLMMPQMDGITLCKKLKRNINTSHIPVIMLTAKAGIENKLEGLETGADAYLTKPFNARELQVRAKSLMEGRTKLRELFSKSESINPREVTVTSLDEQFLQKTLDLLEERYSEPDFGIPQMQEILAMSRAQLHRKIKAITNEAPGEMLRNFRIKRAAQILGQQGENVTQVAYMVGFNNLSYFAKCFKQFYGVAPSKFHKGNTRS